MRALTRPLVVIPAYNEAARLGRERSAPRPGERVIASRQPRMGRLRAAGIGFGDEAANEAFCNSPNLPRFGPWDIQGNIQVHG